MARKPMVTRTIITTKATVMCLNIDTNTPVTQEFVLPRTFSDEKKVLKALNSITADTPIKPVHIISMETSNTLYGMAESRFMELAEILPARTSPESNADEPDTTND